MHHRRRRFHGEGEADMSSSTDERTTVDRRFAGSARHTRGAIICALLSAVVMVSPAGAHAFTYWGTSDAIGRAEPNGTGVDQSFIGGESGCMVAVDGSHVYWSDFGNHLGSTVGRANLNGTGVVHSFITTATEPCGVAVDGGHVYWTNVASGTIGRARLDGTDVNQSFIDGGTSAPCGMAVDGAHVYWANENGTTIGRARLDGTGIDQGFIDGALYPCGVAVDGAHVYCANLD